MKRSSVSCILIVAALLAVGCPDDDDEGANTGNGGGSAGTGSVSGSDDAETICAAAAALECGAAFDEKACVSDIRNELAQGECKTETAAFYACLAHDASKNVECDGDEAQRKKDACESEEDVKDACEDALETTN